MIPIIYGWKRWPELKWGIGADCPWCGVDTVLSGIQVKRHVTLYAIPLMRLLSEWTVGCPECGLVWKVSRDKWQGAEKEVGGRASLVDIVQSSFALVMQHVERQRINDLLLPSSPRPTGASRRDAAPR